MEGAHVVGAGPGGLDNGGSPVGSKGKAPVAGLKDKVPRS